MITILEKKVERKIDRYREKKIENEKQEKKKFLKGYDF